MLWRLLRFLFALPVALTATGATATTVPSPPPDRPESENGYTQAAKAAEDPPSVEVADEDQPKFPEMGYSPTDRDAQPVMRAPPEYPEECLAGAKPKETVFIEFDVPPTGKAVNLRIISSTNPCFNKAAIASIERWRYAPIMDDSGKPRWRRGVETAITFELS